MASWSVTASPYSDASSSAVIVVGTSSDQGSASAASNPSTSPTFCPDCQALSSSLMFESV